MSAEHFKGTLYRDPRGKKIVFEVKVQPSYDMKCKESSILKLKILIGFLYFPHNFM